MIEFYFIAGAFFGGILGFVIAALMNICAVAEEREEHGEDMQ